jgi:hypothetical protein
VFLNTSAELWDRTGADATSHRFAEAADDCLELLNRVGAEAADLQPVTMPRRYAQRCRQRIPTSRKGP